MSSMARERALEDALFRLYKEWARLPIRPGYKRPYYAERFRQMIVPDCRRYKGGIAAAREVIYGGTTGGFSFLRDQGHLDLSVENLILQAEWADLFTDRDRLVACQKLRRFSK
jgi:hypothetical protein